MKCFQDAKTDEEKKTCQKSGGKALAGSLGVNEEKISEAMIGRSMREKTLSEVAKKIAECKGIDCAEQMKSELVRTISSTEGTNEADIPKTYIHEIVGEIANEKTMEALTGCMDEGSERKVCIAQAKIARANATGENIENITDGQVEKEALKALHQRAANIMRSCMAKATTDEDKCECRREQGAMLKRFTGKEASHREAKEMMDKAAAIIIKETATTCEGEKSSCLEKIKEEVAKQKDKIVADVTSLEVTRMLKKAALNNVETKISACREARKTKADAECENPYDAYTAVTKARAREGVKKQIDENNMKKAFAKAVSADLKMMCVGSEAAEDSENLTKCFRDAAADLEKTCEVLYDGVSREQKQRRCNQANSEATIGAAGDYFFSCIKAATDDDSKKACRTKVSSIVESARAVAAEAGDAPKNVDDVMHQYKGLKLAEDASACDSTDSKACRSQAKQEAIAEGVILPRQFLTYAKLGAIKAAAKKFASSKEVDATDALRVEEAKAAFMQVTGLEEKYFNEQILNQVKKLGQALLDGNGTKIIRLKKLEIGAGTDGSACSSSVGDKIRAAITKAAKDADAALGSAISEDCSLMDAKPLYAFSLDAAGVPMESIETKAEAISTEIQGKNLDQRRLAVRTQQRRLTTLSDAYVSQGLQECAVADSTCNEEGQLPGTGTSGEPSPTTAAGGTTSDAKPITFATILLFIPLLGL